MKINLYTGNHNKLDGIEDYLSFMTELFDSRSIDFQISTKLEPKHTNIIIDEFSNIVESTKLTAFKSQHPSTRVIFLLTEFTESRWGVTSFNHFGGIFSSAAITLFDLYLRVIRKDLRAFQPPWTHWLKLIPFAPFIGIEMGLNTLRYIPQKMLGKPTRNPIAQYVNQHQHAIYLHMRYLGLKSVFHHADGFITIHANITPASWKECASNRPYKMPIDLGLLYPEINDYFSLNNQIAEKKLFIEITGSLTKYRRHWLTRINRQLQSLGMHRIFGPCRALPFAAKGSSKTQERGAYSLHPPQIKNWLYCSPTRIFRALAIDNNLPIITHYFQQHPIEDICYFLRENSALIDLYTMHNKPQNIKKFLFPKIKIYNMIAASSNDELIKKLKRMAKTKEQSSAS